MHVRIYDININVKLISNESNQYEMISNLCSLESIFWLWPYQGYFVQLQTDNSLFISQLPLANVCQQLDKLFILFHYWLVFDKIFHTLILPYIKKKLNALHSSLFILPLLPVISVHCSRFVNLKIKLVWNEFLVLDKHWSVWREIILCFIWILITISLIDSLILSESALLHQNALNIFLLTKKTSWKA